MVEHACHASTRDWDRKITSGKPATEGDTVSKKKKKKGEHDECPPCLSWDTGSPSPAHKQSQNRQGQEQYQLLAAAFLSIPAILGDSEFRLGLVNSGRPRPPMAGSVPPDVHSCSQILARRSYFRIPPPSQAPLLLAPAVEKGQR